MALVSISIVTYNGEKWIQQCLESIKKQSYQNWNVLIIDNGSRDQTVKLAKKEMSQARLICLKKNIGFSAGHNLGISQSQGKYILCLNQDVILGIDFIKQAKATLESDRRIGAVQGKLFRMQNRELKTENAEIIDTTGLTMLKNRWVINRGQGEIDQGQYNKIEEVFGADGAAPVYRKQALETVFLPPVKEETKRGLIGEYFDQDFFAYKEDIDLSWRLRLAGWNIIYQPQAVAWHNRGAAAAAVGTGRRLIPVKKDIIKQRQQISKFCRQLSWKNQRLMQIKNELPGLFWRHLPWVFWRELKTAGYILFCEPWMLKSVMQFWRQAPAAWQKRKQVMAKKTMTVKAMKKWFV